MVEGGCFTINSMQEPHWILTNVQQLFKLDSRVQKWVSTLHTKYSAHDGSANGSTNNNKRHYIHLLLCFPRIVCTIRRDFLILRRALTPINKTTWGWFFSSFFLFHRMQRFFVHSIANEQQHTVGLSTQKQTFYVCLYSLHSIAISIFYMETTYGCVLSIEQDRDGESPRTRENGRKTHSMNDGRHSYSRDKISISALVGQSLISIWDK